MLENRIYSFSELLEAIQKESLDSKPVMGKNVQNNNSKNNEKAVNDILKQTKDYNDVKQEKRSTNPENITDFNKTTLDVDFAYEPSDGYKERVEAQVEGYPSVENKKTSDVKDNESLEFEGNKNFYDSDVKKQKEVSDKKEDEKQAGLKTHNQKLANNKAKHIYKENKTMKRLNFNKEFLNEEHVLSKVPDDYKTDGNRFMMKDIKGNEYIIECKKDKHIDYIYTEIVQINKPEAINEFVKRTLELGNYKSSDYFTGTTNESRLQEDVTIKENLDKMKELMTRIDKSQKK